MFLLDIRQAYRKFVRLVQILLMIAWHFLSDWFTGTRFYRFFKRPKSSEEAFMRSTPSRLRENVTSPGGTTAAALEVLQGADGLDPLLERAVTAARDRARALSG